MGETADREEVGQVRRKPLVRLGVGVDQPTGAGFVILQANNRNVRTVADLRAAVAAARTAGREGLLLLVRTSQGNVPVVLELAKAAASE